MSKKTKAKIVEGQIVTRNRSDDYNPEMCELIVEAGKNGKLIAGMMVSIGIRSRTTFNKYRNEHPEFDQAYQDAKLESQAIHEDILLQGAMGKIKNFNFSSMAMRMNNAFPEDYNRSGVGGNSINIDKLQVNNIDSLSNKQLDVEVSNLLKKLKGTIPLEETDNADILQDNEGE